MGVRVAQWPHLGTHGTRLRVLKDGTGFQHGPVCPRCRSMGRAVAFTAIRSRAAWDNLHHRQAHCTSCRVRWDVQGVNGCYGHVTSPGGVDWRRLVARGVVPSY